MNKEYWTKAKTEAKNLKALIKKQDLERIDFVKSQGKTLLKAFKNRWAGGIKELIDDVSAQSVSTIIRDYRNCYHTKR